MVLALKRSALLFLLLLFSVSQSEGKKGGGFGSFPKGKMVEGNGEGDDGGILAFLARLVGMEHFVTPETWGFFRFFGRKLHPDKVNLASKCDYNDPNLIQVS